MSHFKRNLLHQQIAARQDNSITLVDPGTTTTKPGPGNGGGGGGGGGGNSSTTRSTKSSTSSPTKSTESTKTTEKPDPETTKSKETSSPSSTNTASETTSTPKSTSSGSTTINQFTPLPNTNSFVPILPTSTDDTAATPSITSASDNTATGASVNTGAIIGGIAGGLAGIALLGLIISFIMRRLRSRRREAEFDAAQFRNSAMIVDGGGDARPHSLFGGRFGGFAPSIRASVAGAGMAGHGAYKEYSDNTPTQPEMQYHDATPTTATDLHPRQQYTYGEAYDNAASRDDDYTHGAYSEQPQPQAVYNLEAYGDYDSYSSGNGVQYPATSHQSRKHQDDPYGGI